MLKKVIYMIEYVKGNIFDSPAQVIVNPVNTVGVMGKGLALEFKKKYPEMFSAYKKMCENKALTTGKLMLHFSPDHWILLFPTKEHWRNPSKIEYIENGLKKFVNTYAEKNITSIAFPKLGCGNGELDWAVVKPLMEKYLKPLPIDIYIYLGNDISYTPEHKAQGQTMEWLKRNAIDMSFNSVKDDIESQANNGHICFVFETNLYKGEWNNGLKLESPMHEEFFGENELYIIWDTIRKKELFSYSKDKKTNLLYTLLFYLGYLSPVMIEAKGMKDLIAGFQLNKGLGRMFSLEV